MMRVLLTGGGSGGHVSPVLAIAEAIRNLEPDTRFLYIGVRQGLEADLVPRAGIPIKFAPSIGMPSGMSFAMLRFLFTLAIGVIRAMGHMLRFRPHTIVASGGFASAPAVFAAASWRVLSLGLWRIPVYLHEQNALPGRMNTAAARIADRLGVVHPVTVTRIPHAAAEAIGYPVREGFSKIDRAEARRKLNIPDDAQYVVVTGGSQGARTINRAMVDALPYLADRENLRIVHSTGAMKIRSYNAEKDTKERLEQVERLPEHYRLETYLHDLPLHLAAADIAVIRAGSGSLVETCTLGVAAIVIPKANVPGDSQVGNARELAVRGAIELIYEEPEILDGKMVDTVPGEVLAGRILTLLTDNDRRMKLAERASQAFDPGAAERIARRVRAMAKEVADIEPDEPVEVLKAESDIERLPQSPVLLRRNVEQMMGVRYENAFEHGPIRDHELSRLHDLPYLHYRGATLLTHPAWQMRNEGVKLLGLTRHVDKLHLVTWVLTDRTPAPGIHRLLGGDFEQVGFIRRNAINALAFIGVVDDNVRAAVIIALGDPYYEVRAAALRLVRMYIRQSKPLNNDKDLVQAVRKLTRDSSLEVRWEALDTYGHVGEPEDVLAVNRTLALVQKAPLREAVLRSYHALLDRYPGVTDSQPWRNQLKEDLERFAITSLAFQPHFPLKERFAVLQRRIHEEPTS